MKNKVYNIKVVSSTLESERVIDEMDQKKFIYKVLKDIEQNKKLYRDNYNFSLKEWGNLISLIKREGYATGIAVAYVSNTIVEVSVSSAKLTMKGVEFFIEPFLYSLVYSKKVFN